MSTTTCAKIITRVNTLLQDTNLRWTDTELLDWINESYRAIALVRPDAAMKTTYHQCTGKSKQLLTDTSAQRLRSVTRNLKTASDGTLPGKAVRHSLQRVLDDQVPNWHNTADSTNGAQFYVHDPLNPLVFYLYPQPPNTWYVEVVYYAAPAVSTLSSDVISIDEVYAPCILDYVCYRAYSKDAEYAANAQLAQAYFSAFMSKLQANTQASAAIAPTSDGKVTL